MINTEETETLAFTYMNLFTRPRDITSCPWTKQSHVGKCNSGKLNTSTLVNDGTIRSTADFTSALRNANNLKITDLFEFLVIFLFSSLCSHPKIICRKLQDYKNIHGGDSFDNLKKSLVEVYFHFHLQLFKNIPEWLLSYEVTSSNL